MSTSHQISSPAFLRNAFALKARGARSSVFKDRRTPRGGSQNWQQAWLDELLDEGEPAPVSAPEAR